MGWISGFWSSLSGSQRTLVIVLFAVLLAFVLATTAFGDADFSGVGGWLRDFVQ